MSALKLLVLSYEYPPIGGGGGVMLKNLVERLNPNEYSVTVITTWFKNLSENEVINGIDIHRVKSKRTFEWQSNPMEMLSWVKFAKNKAEELIRLEKFHLVISNFVVPGGILALHLFKKHQLPYICISHGHDIPWVKPYSLYPFFFVTQWKIKNIIKCSKGVVTLSSELEKNAINFIGKSNKHLIQQIPNGFDENFFYPQKKHTNEIPKLLFVGRLVSQKGIKTLLKTALELKKQISFELTIVGDGPKRKFMENFCRDNNLDSHCVFLGKIKQEELAKLYAQSDLLIAPSISEGMSLVIIEALSCNLFVVSSSVSGVRDLIRNNINGYIIQKNNYKEFTKYLFDYLKINHNSDLIVNIESGNCCMEILNWEIIANKYSIFIKNLNLDKDK